MDRHISALTEQHYKYHSRKTACANLFCIGLTWTFGLFVRFGQFVFDRLEPLLNAAQLYFDSDESTAVKEDGQNRKNCSWTNWIPGSFFKRHLAMAKFGSLVFWSRDWRSFQLNVQVPAESRGSSVYILWHDLIQFEAVLCFMLFYMFILHFRLWVKPQEVPTVTQQ